MSVRSRRLVRDLEALGFRRDDSVQCAYDATAWTHANDPEQAIKVYPSMTDSSATLALKRARKIAEISTSGDSKPQTIRERAEIGRAKQRARQKAEEDSRLRRAEAAEAVWKMRQERARRERADRETRDLMQPGYGH